MRTSMAFNNMHEHTRRERDEHLDLIKKRKDLGLITSEQAKKHALTAHKVARVNAGTGRRLSKKEQEFKMKWLRGGR